MSIDNGMHQTERGARRLRLTRRLDCEVYKTLMAAHNIPARAKC